jgi:hypothetical protein
MPFEVQNEADLANVDERLKACVNAAVKPPRVLSVAEILELKVSKPENLIEGILPATGASLIVGAPKSGKTLNAAQMAIAVAAGVPLYGNYKILKQGPVLFVEKDDPAGAASIQDILNKSEVPVSGIPFHLWEPSLLKDLTFGPEWLVLLEASIRDLQLRLVVVDSYTAMRGPRQRGIDIVKCEQQELTEHDALAKRTGCAIQLIHHTSKGSAGLDWSEKAAGTFAMGAATESQINISRFPEMDIAAPERLVRIRGRHAEDLEMVLRFRKEHLDFDFVLAGGAASLYPELISLQTAFGTKTFTPKNLTFETGLSRTAAHRLIHRLYRAGVLNKHGYGEYVLVNV